MVITGGQRNDGVMLAHVLAEIHVPRLGPGRPRTRPDAVIADRAYTSGVTRAELRRRLSSPTCLVTPDGAEDRLRVGGNLGLEGELLAVDLDRR